MKLEKKLVEYRDTVIAKPEEEDIQKTIIRSKLVFYASEEKNTTTYYEFLLSQLKLIKKRWWIAQVMVLIVLWKTMIINNENLMVIRNMGVVATLFVIIMIPELWKNRTNSSMEIEGTCLYSLKQIYAARLVLFGVIDVFFITIFCIVMSTIWSFSILELLVHFLLPMSVPACICFGTLGSKYQINESMTVTFCMIWSALWSFVLLNERIYGMITLPLWILAFIVALLLLVKSVYQLLKETKYCWEVPVYGITTK